MKQCPFCKKNNDDTAEVCSCGYYFNQELYQKKVINDNKIERKTMRKMKIRKVFYVLIPILTLLLFRVSKELKITKSNKLNYTLSSDYVSADNKDFYELLNNSDFKQNVDVTKKIFENFNGVLFTRKDNYDEQVIIFEKPVTHIKSDFDINKFFDDFHNLANEKDSKFFILDEDRADYTKTGKNRMFSITIGYKNSNGDKRYSVFNIIKINTKYYEVIIYTENPGNTINKLIRIKE